MTIPRICALLVVPFLLAGCTTVTNLTPSTHERNRDNLYPFEVALDTRERAIRKETIRPFVVIGLESYPMEPTPLVRGRWETLVPIPPNRDSVEYRYKFDYEELAIPQRRRNSKMSEPYILRIMDR